MSNQIVITSGAKLRDLDDVIIGTDGILSSVAFNVANGVPRLDENGKILVSQLPNSVMEFKGVWNAATNSPFLENGVGNAGDVWLCNEAGTVDFGDGPIYFAVGDYAVYTGTVWARSSGATGTVTSVGVSRDGNALTISGSPVTSAGTINLGFSGDNTQYINGAGNLTTFPTVINSIGLTMPAAFGVSNSPLVANGTIGVTALGYPSQYIRGDGTLADFPTSGGGGSSVSYYLNGGTSQGTIGGTTYYEMSKIANTGTGVDFSKTGDGFITAFLTDAGDPALLQIPAGNWNYEIYASMSSNGGTPEMYAELYVYDGTTFTLLSTSAHEILYDGVNLNLYTFAMAVPETVLTVTDRLAIKLYATNSGGKTTTVHTQDSHLCQVITTFTTGLTALNGLTSQVQYFATGTSGSDFNIVSSVSTHTFNIPSASATARGLITTGTQTIAGSKTITGTTTFTGGPILSDTNLTYANSGYTLVLQSPTLSVNRTVTLPNGTGTLALTSDISYPVTSVFGRTGAVVATSGDYTTTQVTEGLTNLYFTDARARTAISLTTTGSTGAATYNNTTGVLNIPNYADQYVGTVTSVAMSVPTGLTVSGSPITSSGTLAVTLTAGYSIPTTTNQSTWTTAYNRSLTSAAVTGTTTKTLTLNQQDGGTITASWTDINTDAVTSVFGRTGAVVATEGDYTLTQLGDVTITSPTTGQVLKYNGTTWINDTDANTGTVTSVAMTVPTGLSIAGSPITSSGTLAVTFAAGYSIPTNASQTTWDTAYTNRITSLTTTGTSGAATLTSNTLNIPQYQAALTNPVTGTGLTNRVAKFNSNGSTITYGLIYDDGGAIETNAYTYITKTLIPRQAISYATNFKSLVNNTSGWIYLGNLVIPQQGYNACITMEAGLGFNAVATNLGYLKLHLRTSNTTPSGGFYFTAFAEQFGNSSNFITEIRITENIATNTYGIYVYSIQFIGIGYYKVEGSGIEYTPVETATTPPATYYQVPLAFTVNSSTTINNTLSVNNVFDAQASTFSGDVRVYRSSAATTGYINFGSTGTNYFGWNGSGFVANGNLNATSFIKTGGTSSQFLKADGSVDSTSYGTGSVTSVAMTVPTGLTVSGTPITTSGTLAITLTSGYSIPTTASQTNWDSAYTNRITSLTTTGTSGAATLVSNVLNIPNYGSALSGYLPLTGGTLTGPLGGTSATFSTTISSGGTITSGDSIAMGGELYYGGISSNRKLRAYSSGSEGSATLNYSFWTGSAWSIVSTLTSGGAANFIGSISAYNFSGTSSGTNTGDQDLSGYVTLATTQTISGAKTFTSTITATQINLGGGAGQNQLQSAANNDFILSNSGNFRIINNTNTSALLTITNAGVSTFSSTLQATNIGIGNAPTGTKLFANQTTAGEWIATFKNYGTTNSYGVSIDMSGSTSVQSALQIYTSTGTGFRFHNNGRFTIGTFTDNGYILDASGMIRATGTIRTDQGFTYEGGIINVTGGTTSWIKLGTISIAQGGNTAVITIEGGSGYNADEGQNGSARIFIRTSNGSPNGSGWYYSATLTQMGYNSNVASNCIITQTNATTYDIYVEFGPYSGNTYYKVEGSAFTWTASNSNYGATAPTGGQTLTKVFKVISPATFAGSVTANGLFSTIGCNFATSSGSVNINNTTNTTYKLSTYNNVEDTHVLIAGLAPSLRFADTVTGITYSTLFGMATIANNFITGSSAGDFAITWGNTKKCYFGYTNATAIMVLDGGNLGLGTLTVGSKAQINGNLAVGYSSSTAAPTNGILSNGGFKSSNPTGGTAQTWKLGSAYAGTISSNYYVNVEINGVSYSLLASNAV